MKLLHSLALVAVFVLIANTVVPSEAAGLWWSNSSDKKDEPTKLELTMPKDEEANDDDDAKLDNLDYKDDVQAAKPNQPNFQRQGGDETKPKIQIQDDDQLENVQTIHELGEPINPNVPLNSTYTYNYDREPQQSPFVDQAAHPTQSQGADPRFAQPRQCQDGQYLCRKAHPQQEHIRCIPAEWKCNGVRDCEENDDEDGCNANVPATRPAPPSCIAPQQYTCYGTGVNGIPPQCVDARRLCDGVYDCNYGDDEGQDRCAQFATRREPTVVPSGATQPNHANAQPTEEPQRPVQNAPPQYPYPSNQPEAQPQPQPREPEPAQCAQSSRSEEYVKRLEWIDRCFRSCLKY